MEKSPSDSFNIKIPKPNLSSVSFVLLAILMVASFALGSLWTKNNYLEQQIKAAKETSVAGATTQTTTQATTKTTINIDAIKALFNAKNITFGDKNKKNLIVEIADPSCPYCAAAAGRNSEIYKSLGSQFMLDSDGGTYTAPVPKIKELIDSGKASFVWIYYPGHGNGEMGTKALYCANEKGKFWEVHDKLMSSQGYDLLNTQVKNDKTKSQDVATFLADVIDANQLKTCLDSGKYETKLQEDVATATSLFKSFDHGGTPGFIINTTIFGGAYSWKDMASAVK